MRKEEKNKPSFASAFAKASADKKASEGREKESRESEISLDDIPFVGGLLKGLEKFVDLAERVEKAGGEIKKTGRIKGTGPHKDIQGVYGFTIRTGLGKKTKIEPFGNIKKTKEGPKMARAREPIVDVFDEKEYVTIIAELPGAHEKTIKLELKGDILVLRAGDTGHEYEKEILLPASVRGEARPNGRPAKIDFASKEMKFRNGVLEIKFKKIK